MKKFLTILLILSLLFSASACTHSTEYDSKLKIVTTVFPPYDFARQICGDYADIKMLLKPGMESHTYDPTTKDIIDINNADIFIYTGGESENWADKILSSLDTEKTKIISMLDVVDNPIEQSHHKHTHNDTKYDEHVWTSPKNAIKITQAISNAIISTDEKNANIYVSNTEKFISQLNGLDEEFANMNYTKPLIVGDRFPFSYLTCEYDINYYSAFSSCSEESEPGIKTMSALIEHTKANNVPVVFYIEFSNQKIASTISEATGAKKLMLHSCHNLSEEEFKSGKTYLQLMRDNLNNIKEAQK